MEARNLETSDHAPDHCSEQILALSKMDYQQAQVFLRKYWQTDFYKNLEAQFNSHPNGMSADDYILFVLSRKQGCPDYDKLFLSCHETTLTLNEETHDHLNILLLILKLSVTTGKIEKHIANMELRATLERRMLKVDPTLYQRIHNWNATQMPKYDAAKLQKQIFENKEYDESLEERSQRSPELYLPDPLKNPELFPIHQLLMEDIKNLRVHELKDDRTETYLPDLKPTFLNLSSLPFKRVKLPTQDLYGVYLRKADFTNARMPNIFNSDLSGSILYEAWVSELRACYLHDVKFNQAKLLFARIQESPYLAPSDFASFAAFSSAIGTLRQNLADNHSSFHAPFELKVVTDIIDFIKRFFKDRVTQVHLLDKMHAHYLSPKPTDAFYAEWNKTHSLWSAAPSFFGAMLPRNKFDPAAPCLRLIKDEIIRIGEPLLTELQTEENQHRPAMNH